MRGESEERERGEKLVRGEDVRRCEGRKGKGKGKMLYCFAECHPQHTFYPLPANKTFFFPHIGR